MPEYPTIPEHGPMAFPGKEPEIRTARDAFRLVWPVLKEAGCEIIFDSDDDYVAIFLPNTRDRKGKRRRSITIQRRGDP